MKKKMKYVEKNNSTINSDKAKVSFMAVEAEQRGQSRVQICTFTVDNY